MEPQNLNEEIVEVEVKTGNVSQLHKVTPLSKYLAMLLFILMPFLGGWIGYNYASQKVVEKVGVEEVLVEEIKVTKLPEVGLPYATNTFGTETQYLFHHDNFSINFDYLKEVRIKDNFSASDGSGGESINVWFFWPVPTDLTYNEPRLQLYVHTFRKQYCWLDLCNKEVESSVNLYGKEWEYLGYEGSYECYENTECYSFHVYRANSNGLFSYIKVSEQLHDEETKNQRENLGLELIKILASLEIAAAK